MSETTTIFESDYPQENEVLALLEESQYQYKWGGPVGTASSVTYSFASSETFTLDQQYSDSILSYTFVEDDIDIVETLSDPRYEFKTYSPEKQESIKDSLSYWSDATGIEFIEVNEALTNVYGDVRFFLMEFSSWENIDPFYDGTAGFAYLPSYVDYDDALMGDVFIDSDYTPGDGYFEHLLTHEIGHAIGLSHPFDGLVNIDLKNYESVMGYDYNYFIASQPMPADIKAGEFLYGGNSSANINDDTYSFNTQSDLIYRTSIIDKDGDDIFDFSQQLNGVYVNLEPNSWSSLDYPSDIENLTEDDWVYENGQIYISENSFIESLNGSDFNDIISDNSSNNTINAGAGNDTIFWSSGNDTIDGGSNEDTLELESNSFSDIISIDYDTVNNNYEIEFANDTIQVSNIENIIDQSREKKAVSTLFDELIEVAPPNEAPILKGGSRIELDVTVLSGTNSYGSGNKYYIDGDTSPTLDLIVGNTYEFDLTAVSASHPLYLSSTLDGRWNSGSEYTEGVTITEDGNGKQVKLTIEVTADTPDLYYYCHNHPGMGADTKTTLPSVEENADITTVIYDADATDPDGGTLTYSVSGTDADYVTIDEDNGEVRLLNPADYEIKDSYTFEVSVSDGDLSDTETVTVNVIENVAPNEAPTLTGGSGFMFKAENTSSDTVLSTYTADDANGDILTYSLSGSDGALFNITNNGELSFIDPPDHESDKIFYSLIVNVSDNDLTDTQSVAILIRDVIETTTLSAQDYSASLIGGSEIDYLYGGYGKDILEGGAGDDLIDGGPGKDTIVFGDGDTRLNLSPANDGVAQNTQHGNDTIMTSTIENITTGAGNDIIIANAADNIMDTGDGDDRLSGADGDDVLIAGLGNDHLYGSYGKDNLNGGEGNDRLYGDYGNDILEGGAGNDILDGGAGKDTIVFGNNNTHISLSAEYDGVVQPTGHGNDTIMTSSIENVTTGDGNDTITANSLDNVLLTGDGDDRLYGEAGDDTLTAGDGDDWLLGSYGNDSLEGGNGHDRLNGGYGNDILEGGTGDDTLDGGLGKDTLVFGNGNTTVSLADDKDGIAQDTGHGSDTIMTSTIENVTTGDGTDVIEGNGLDNILDGGAGDDTLTGGYGDDTLTGGSGEDTFVLDAIFGDDTITDFDGSSDMIDLSAIVGASVTTAANSDGDVKLTVEDSQGQEQGTLTLEDVSLDDWNAMDQGNILLYTV
jgi:Ca2+-binding RTX toxin-like protein